MAEYKGSKLAAATLAAVLAAGPVEAVYSQAAPSPEQKGQQTGQVDDQYKSQHPLRIAFSDFEVDSDNLTNASYMEMLEREIPDAIWYELKKKGYDVIENNFLKAKLAKKNIAWADFMENPYLAVGEGLDDVDVIIYGDAHINPSNFLEVIAKYINVKTGEVKIGAGFTEDISKYRARIPKYTNDVAEDLEEMEKELDSD
jgi:hypothetical protein